MANDKKNIKVLVATDDDPTAELEALVLPTEDVDDESEASATTTGYVKADSSAKAEEQHSPDLEFGSHSNSATVENLKFDLEVLGAKWQGLSTEIEARKDQVNRLNSELEDAQLELKRSASRIAERDERIQSLERLVANRDDAYMGLADELEKLHQSMAGNTADESLSRDRLLQEQAGQLAGTDMENRELRARLSRVEGYADQLRYQLRLKIVSAGDLDGQIEILEQQLTGATTHIADLQTELDASVARNAELESSIKELHNTHAEEIRMIRFELGDAQETLAQHEQVAEELASDLVRTRSQREELESELAKAEEYNQSRISELEESNRRLRREVDGMREKLQSKSEAINSLLAELAQNPKLPDSASRIEETIQKIDERMSERIDDRNAADKDRVTRLLTGHIDGQKLRFPLFKDRLTIGRTAQNDIQLKSQHVSRRHAVVVIESDVTRVIDWGSKNGVFVNSRRIKEHFLKNGDVVTVGTAEFRYEERPKREN